MIITESQIRKIIKSTLLNNFLKESKENKSLQQKEFSQNILKILDLCKNKIKQYKMWSDDSIEQQKDLFVAGLFNAFNDTAQDSLKRQGQMEKLKKNFPNSPLEILLNNLITNKNFFKPVNKKDKRPALIELINNEKNHAAIVSRLISTLKYRQKNNPLIKDNPIDKYKNTPGDYTTPEAERRMNTAFDDIPPPKRYDKVAE